MMSSQVASQKTLTATRSRWWPWRFTRWQGLRGSIATRLVVFSILLVTLAAAFIGSLAYLRARHALEKEARVRLTVSAWSIAEHLQRAIEDRVADTTNWARLEVMRAILYEDVDKELAQFLGQIVQGRPLYRAIVCFDAHGRQLAGAGESGAVIFAGHALRPHMAIIPAARESDERMLQLDTPIFNPDHPDVITGTLVVLLDPHRLVDTTALLRTVGTQVLLTLRSRSGETLMQTGISRHGQARGQETGAVLTGAAAVGPLSDVDGPELQVVVAEPAEVALASVSGLRATLVRISMLALFVSSLLGALVAWRIALPIRRLTDQVRQITESGQIDSTAEFPNASGEIGVLTAAFRAMMERLAAAQAEAVAQSRLAFLGEIAANVAHEVRTPLAVLKTSAQILTRPGADVEPAEQHRLASTIAGEVDRLNRVVTDLVDLARPKAVHYRTESIPSVINRAVTFFRPLAAKAAVRLVQTIGQGDLRGLISADQLYQVFLNLIQNAIQAMHGPGVVTVRCSEDGSWVVVDVEDTGPGVSAAVLERLFSPFYTTKPDGAGLGLAISKRIIEEHGGSIAAENLEAGGARFRLRLPKEQAR